MKKQTKNICFFVVFSRTRSQFSILLILLKCCKHGFFYTQKNCNVNSWSGYNLKKNTQPYTHKLWIIYYIRVILTFIIGNPFTVEALLPERQVVVHAAGIVAGYTLDQVPGNSKIVLYVQEVVTRPKILNRTKMT